MINKKILRNVFIDLFFTVLAVAILLPFNTRDISDASAEESLVVPYTKTFTISAYYSPLPCQERYATGSYEADKRLNGSGVNGASGKAVYPGMIAAPRTYDFGTKMYVPNIGIVGVYDRGGAIVTAGNRGQAYDRLDIWMGWGDKGLTRALNWGKRVIDVTVYGVTDAVQEDIFLSDFSYDEAEPDCSGVSLASEVTVDEVSANSVSKPKTMAAELISNLSLGSSGPEVLRLQKELAHMNFYRGEFTGNFDDLTKHAVFKFQQSQGLVETKSDLGAGNFGPRTRDRVSELVANRLYTNVMIAEHTNAYNEVFLAEVDAEEIEPVKVALSGELDFGMNNDDVADLQRFLHSQGYMESDDVTSFFGESTRRAVLNFQLEEAIIRSKEELGAGRVGPKTLELINAFYS